MVQIQVQGRWLLDATSIPVPANQSLIQIGEGASIYLTFGHANPPVIEGLENGGEPTAEQIAAVSLLVVPVSRLVMPLDKLLELRGKIDEILAQIESDSK